MSRQASDMLIHGVRSEVHAHPTKKCHPSPNGKLIKESHHFLTGTCMYMCTLCGVYVCMCMGVQVHMCMCVYDYRCMVYVHMCVHMYICMHMFVYRYCACILTQNF